MPSFRWQLLSVATIILTALFGSAGFAISCNMSKKKLWNIVIWRLDYEERLQKIIWNLKIPFPVNGWQVPPLQRQIRPILLQNNNKAASTEKQGQNQNLSTLWKLLTTSRGATIALADPAMQRARLLYVLYAVARPNKTCYCMHDFARNISKFSRVLRSDINPTCMAARANPFWLLYKAVHGGASRSRLRSHWRLLGHGFLTYKLVGHSMGVSRRFFLIRLNLLLQA